MADDDLRTLERRFSSGDVEAGHLLLAARERAGLCVFHGEVAPSCSGCAAARAIDWPSVFFGQQSEVPAGASAQELQALANGLGQPLSEAELGEANELASNLASSYPTAPRIDPASWPLPSLPLPPAYLSLLAWSNGGLFTQGDREFGFFPTTGVRGYLLSHQIPEYMPGAVPIAFDGGGTFYLLDMRRPPVGGEYPILFCHAGNLCFEPDMCRVVANSFLAACQGTTDPHED